MTTTPVLPGALGCALRQWSLRGGFAFFSTLITVPPRVATTLMLACLVPAAGAAELLVLQPGGSGGERVAAQVWRFDPSTAASLGWFGYFNEGFYAMSVSPENEVFVTSNILGGYDLYRFNRAGAYRGVAAEQPGGDFAGVTRGTDGNLFSIMRRGDGTNPPSPPFVARLDQPGGSTFIASGTGGMANPSWMVRGPDQQLYVLDPDVGILRFNGATGAWLGVFVPLGRGGLSTPRRMIFGADGHCYVSTGPGNSVLRFNGANGAFIDRFVAAGSGGLDDARGLAVGPDGHLHVASRNTHRVLRYHSATGAFLAVAATHAELRFPTDIAFVAGTPVDTLWFDDALPAGAVPATSHGGSWTWVDSNPAPMGARAHRGFTSITPSAGGLSEHSFNFASEPMEVGVGDSLFVHVYIHGERNGDRQIMLSWCDGSWEHRAYWGANLINAGTTGTASRRYMGTLPAGTGWFRLEVPANLVGLEGARVQGMSFSTYNLPVTFDLVGRTSHVARAADVTPPTARLTAPAAGATVSGLVTLSAEVRDNVQVASVRFFVDSTALDGPGTSTSLQWNASWDSRSVANGTYALTAVATDTAGNRTTSAAVSVTVRNATAEPAPTYWVDDALPTGAWGGGSGGDGWNWVTTNPAPFAGTRAHQSNLASGFHEHYFNEAAPPLAVGENDLLIAHIYLDPGAPPLELMVSWFDGSSWEHRAYWGADHIGYGVNDTASRRYMGPLPGTGTWIRLAVPAGQVGLAGRSVYGMGFAAYGGRVTWDGIGKIASTTDEVAPTVAITSPAAGAQVSGTVTIAIGATGNRGVAAVDLQIDQQPPVRMTAAPYTFSWNTAGVSNGMHVLSAVATDAAGLVSSRASVTVQVANAAPIGADFVWFDDAIPGGAVSGGNGGDGWNWVTSNPAPRSGTRAHQSNIAAGLHEHYIDWANRSAFPVTAGDTLFAWVYLDPANMPQEVMLSWRDGNNWEHRAYWGEDLIGYGTHGTASRRSMGALPPAGVWTKLTVPASSVGLGSSPLIGISFSAYGGRVTWDAAGKLGSGSSDTTPPTVSLSAPAANAIVSGHSVRLGAVASDNQAVTSVRFRIDGAEIGVDATAPFSLDWNSATVANGSHAVTAVAADAAGNQTTSAAVIFSVNNSSSTGAVIWMDGNVPAGAWTSASGGDAWTWVTANPAPFAGTRVHQSAIAAGVHDHSFQGATTPFAIYTGDTIFAYVYLDPANVPAEIMLSFNDGTWEHRAYWGANVITYGQDGTNSRRYLGALPAAGQWVKLEVPARLVGLEGRSINGVSFTLVGGRATWDIVGKVSP